MADLEEIRKRMKQRKEMKTSFTTQRQPVATHNNNLGDSHDGEYHYHLAECYYDGLKGYPEDKVKAYQEYQIAADLGHTGAMVELAIAYSDEYDSLLGYDLNKAETWARRAIKDGNPDGYLELYHVYCAKNKNSEALYFLETGVEKGSLDCIEQRAWMLYWGENEYGDDIEAAPEEAFQLVRDRDWTDEHSLALNLLGYYYRDNGNPKLAKEYFERLIRIDDEDYEAMYNLGSLLSSNKAVLDYQRAESLLLTAANNGNVHAMNSLGVMYCLGNGVPQNHKVGKDWIEKAAQNNNTNAMVNMYHILADEEMDKAMYWLKRAAKEGNEDAQNILNGSDNGQQNIDLTRSSQIIDDFMDDWENILNLEPYASISQSFPNRIKRIQDIIDREGLSTYETDRLKAFQAAVSLLYFDYHLHDGGFTSLRKDSYYAILDNVDDLVKGMDTISDEAAFIYYAANLYSADRYQDASPAAKLREFWDNLQEIQLVDGETEWKVDFWKEKVEEIHNYMLLQIGSNYSNSSRPSDDRIKKRVFQIIEDKLIVSWDEIHLYSRLVEDLGADSLDAVELIMEMEKEFDLTIPDQDAQKIRTVGDVVSYIKRHI